LEKSRKGAVCGVELEEVETEEELEEAEEEEGD
jgi:hypothetical protein